MPAATQPFPDFANPPVVEVALSVQFEPLRALRVPQIGLLFRVELLQAHPVPRCWFLNPAGTELIQVQQDRLIHNWRKVGNAESNPRYEHVRGQFAGELDRFREFLQRERLGEFRPNTQDMHRVWRKRHDR